MSSNGMEPDSKGPELLNAVESELGELEQEQGQAQVGTAAEGTTVEEAGKQLIEQNEELEKAAEAELKAAGGDEEVTGPKANGMLSASEREEGPSAEQLMEDKKLSGKNSAEAIAAVAKDEGVEDVDGVALPEPSPEEAKSGEPVAVPEAIEAASTAEVA